MKSLTNKFTAITVLGFIGLFGVLSIGSFSNSEEKLFPELSWDKIADGEYVNELKSNLAGKIAFTDTWKSVGSRFDSTISGNIVNGVFIADDRLIAADILERDNLEDCSEIINSFSQGYDGAVYFVAVPTSAGVYGDLLPSYLSIVTEKQQIDSLYERLNNEIRRVDAYNLMKMLSDNRIYLRSDSKWTIYGAYCLYRTVIQKLGFQPVSFDKYTIRHVTNEYRGDLYNRTLYMKCEPDILDIYEYSDGAQVTKCICVDDDNSEHDSLLYNIDALNSDNMYELYLGEKAPLVKIQTDVNVDRRLLLIGSECAASFVPFLTQHYSEITIVFPEYTDKSLYTFVEPNDYEQTLFLLSIDDVRTDILKIIESR